MPHIKPVRRAIFDDVIEQLPPIWEKADLTFLINRLQMRFVADGEERGYQRHSDAVSAAHDAAHQYEVRVLDPYEEKAAARNGDIFVIYGGTERVGASEGVAPMDYQPADNGLIFDEFGDPWHKGRD